MSDKCRKVNLQVARLKKNDFRNLGGVNHILNIEVKDFDTTKGSYPLCWTGGSNRASHPVIHGTMLSSHLTPGTVRGSGVAIVCFVPCINPTPRGSPPVRGAHVAPCACGMLLVHLKGRQLAYIGLYSPLPQCSQICDWS